MSVTAATRFVAMLGDPVHQARTPAAFNAWAVRNGTDAVMIGMAVPPEALATTLAALRGWRNCLGAVVTYPHKQQAVAALDAAGDAVAVAGACNVIRRTPDGRLVGGMTDGSGFVAALRAGGTDPAGADIRLIGVGGAGSAIALALIDAGAGRLVIDDLDAGRVAALLARLARARPGAAAARTEPAGFAPRVVVNATPVGLNGDPAQPWPLDRLPPDCLVADIVPEPAETPWLAEARRRGHTVQTGPEMVAAQLPAVVAHLFGTSAGGA